MKIAIPVESNRLCSHFGHCERFAFVEIDEKTRQVTQKAEVVPPAHAPGVLPPWLAGQGATKIIAGGMGVRARQMLEAAGIEVILGAPSLPVEELIAAVLSGTLTGGDNTCDHGEEHTCGDASGHDHGHRHGHDHSR